ncbi:MAG: ComEC/Rec2 family competence protein [Algoriphagus sp.]|uniref:ComEC/Rec2 family competence protein n=1 Tax=Algoriphagus sp. TaxID=1872435 RepID=UPI00262F379A|nr:ComEC/Rec2 family competence protein [Algoriphagus sp.]MDG1276940.1 ComEC/Rec2 family competence protein [Algoriphagus sp.]
MRFADYPFLRYLPILIGGILLSKRISFPDFGLVLILLGAGLLIYGLILYNSKFPRKGLLLGEIGYVLLFLTGIFLVRLNEASNAAFQNFVTVEEYVAEVTQYDVAKPNSFENLLQIKAILKDGVWIESDEKVLVYHQSESPFLPGQIIWVKSEPEPVSAPSNPNEFNYKGFLARKGIYSRQFLSKNFVFLDSSISTKPQHVLSHLRLKIGTLLQDKIPDPDSEQIALALLLGQKQYLDPDIRAGYVQAGVMHILAVSGLHVGIIYALFLMLLKPLKLSKKWAKIYLLFVVLLIWIYAFLTGLSPSVVRAATMFSLLSLGQMRERKPSIFNILAFSAMLMIALNPDVIFEVGFQLSYLAVGGIVLIQPLILNWWLPSNRFLEYLWQLTSVSLAAQLSTFPLSVFYFHVFPTYFLLGNLLIIPLAFIIMQVGVPLMLLGWIPIVGDILGWILSWLIWLQNSVIQLIQMIPGGKLDRLTIDFSSMILIWIFLLIWASWAMSKRKNLIYFLVVLTLIWSGIQLEKEVSKPSQELLIYQSKEGYAIDYHFGGKLYSWNQGIKAESLSYLVDPNRIANQWSRFPNPMFIVFSDIGKKSIFPSQIYLDDSKKIIYFVSQKPKTMQVWTDGNWEKMNLRDSVTIGDSAIRIVF